MIYEIRITANSPTDSKGQELLAEIKRTLGIKSIKNIRSSKVYRLEGISFSDAQKFSQAVLFEPINQQMSFNKPIFSSFDKKIEVAYKPGVMNPEVGSLLKAASDLKIKLTAADTSTEYAFWGKVKDKDLSIITNRLLVNETVEQVVKKPPKTLMISGQKGKVEKIPVRNLSDSQLMELSKDRLFLNRQEMKIIKNYFAKISRDPTDCEIEVLAQTWSEHCVHKTFKAKLIVDGKVKKPLIDRIRQTANYNKKLIISAFVDNSGVIDFYDGWAISGKVETHNSPSAIEPYGGAMTGSGGVFRDVLGTGKGAKIIASTDIFCFAPPDLPAKSIPPGCLPPDYILRKVVAGVRDYGNRVGIPTNNGSVHFHPDFRAKCTVGVGSYGLIPKKIAKKQFPKVGDLIVTIGGRTGRDGIHGATFSSGEMTDRTITVLGSAVQIGNAIEEKRMIDAVYDLRDQGLIRAITDCGAGGFSSAIGEMGQKIGARVFLEKAPLKYSGLSPWEIFISESQERMVLAIDPQNLKKAVQICQLHNVEATVIGKFDGSKRLRVTFDKKPVCDLEMQFLHHGLPQRVMKTTRNKQQPVLNRVETRSGETRNKKLPPLPKKADDWQEIFEKVLSHGNVCSKEPIVRMYAHNVQGTNALHPFSGVNLDGPNDGTIVRPILKKPYGVVITHGLNPTLNLIDPYGGSIWAIVEAVSNFISCGGDIKNAALIDNFIWPFPDEESLFDLDQSVDACSDMARLLKMPFISGKDSLSSTYRYPSGKILKIPPVLLISVFGKIPDVRKTVSSDFKSEGSTIVLVGKPDFKNLGGSTYFDVLGTKDPEIPKIDLKSLTKVFGSVRKGITQGQILSCHDISEGGLAAALAEMCFGGNCGTEVDLSSVVTQTDTPGVKSGRHHEDTPGVNLRPDFILFSETAGTFLVEVENPQIAKKLFTGIPYAIFGKTVADKTISVFSGSKNLCNLDLDKLKNAWQKPMREIFH